MSVVHIPQLYLWRVEFEDGTHLSQFDDFGNEILIKNICGNECLKYNIITKQDEIIEFSNYFGEFEKIHGKVVQFGFYPFTESMMQKIHTKQPEIVFAVSKDAVPITKQIPADHFATFKKINLIEYGIDATGNTDYPVRGRLGQMIIGVVNRESKIAEMYQINMVQVKA